MGLRKGKVLEFIICLPVVSDLQRTVASWPSLPAGVVRGRPSIRKWPLKDGLSFIRHRCKGHHAYPVVKLPGQLGPRSPPPPPPKPRAPPPSPRLGSLLQGILGSLLALGLRTSCVSAGGTLLSCTHHSPFLGKGHPLLSFAAPPSCQNFHPISHASDHPGAPQKLSNQGNNPSPPPLTSECP